MMTIALDDKGEISNVIDDQGGANNHQAPEYAEGDGVSLGTPLVSGAGTHWRVVGKWKVTL